MDPPRVYFVTGCKVSGYKVSACIATGVDFPGELEERWLTRNRLSTTSPSAPEVSTATVSRAINSLSSVRPATRDKVMRAMEELEFVPNAVARGSPVASTGSLD